MTTKRWQRAIVAIRLVLLSSVSIGGSSLFAAEIDPKKIDDLVTQALQAWDVPGAAVVIVDGNQVLYLKGHGKRELGKPELVTPDTLFPMASCSKAFTTTLLAMLVGEGKLDWDDPVRKHLKTFHLSDPHADALVSLRDLVSHRTGVAAHDLLWYRPAWDQDEMIRRVGKLPLNKPFRSTMQYQSIMFTAAGKAAGNTIEMPWEKAVQERILEPLGMKSTNLSSIEALKVRNRATGHRFREGVPTPVGWYPQEVPNPAGSVNATARDLVPWLQFHLNEGKHEDLQLVSAKNLHQTYTPQIVIPVEDLVAAEHPETQCMAYGMGWVIQDYRGEKLVSHAGIIDGFRIHLTLLPKQKIAIGILGNLHATRMNLALSNQIVDTILGVHEKRDWNKHYQALLETEAKKLVIRERRLESNRKMGTKPSLGLPQYVGTYEDAAYGTARITLKDGDLYWEWSNFRCKLHHYHDDIYRIQHEILNDPFLEFQCKNPEVVGFEVLDVTFKRRPMRKMP